MWSTNCSLIIPLYYTEDITWSRTPLPNLWEPNYLHKDLTTPFAPWGDRTPTTDMAKSEAWLRYQLLWKQHNKIEHWETRQRKRESDIPLASNKTNQFKYKNTRFNVVRPVVPTFMGRMDKTLLKIENKIIRFTTLTTLNDGNFQLFLIFLTCLLPWGFYKLLGSS